MTGKLYYQNVCQRTFAAHVISCEPKDGKWLVVLDRTAFYPEGGGQPADTGVLNFADVLDVQERGDEIVHTTDRPHPCRLRRDGRGQLGTAFSSDAAAHR